MAKIKKIKPTQFTFSEGSQITNEFTKEIWKIALNFKNFRSKISTRQWQQIAKDINLLNNIIAKNPKVRKIITSLFLSQKPSQKIVENLNEIVIQNYDEIQRISEPLKNMEEYINLWKKIKIYKINTNKQILTTEEWNRYNEIAGSGNEIQNIILQNFTKDEFQNWLENKGLNNDWTINY